MAFRKTQTKSDLLKYYTNELQTNANQIGVLYCEALNMVATYENIKFNDFTLSSSRIDAESGLYIGFFTTAEDILIEEVSIIEELLKIRLQDEANLHVAYIDSRNIQIIKPHK